MAPLWYWADPMPTRDPIASFWHLHESGCFVLPNPWDRGSAKILASLGFEALATTSAGLAFARGRPDSPAALDRDVVLDNIREIVDATELPVNADFQAGYGETPEAVAHSVSRCVDTGVAGLSIEDASGDDARPLFECAAAVDRVRAAREAIDASGRRVLLTARAECFLVGHPDPLAESLERLRAYAEAGADCLYAPGLRTAQEITAIVEAVAPKPVNVIAPATMSVAELAELGVRRISIGSALARVAWRAFVDAARHIQTTGTFSPLTDAEPFATFNTLFGDSSAD